MNNRYSFRYVSLDSENRIGFFDNIRLRDLQCKHISISAKDTRNVEFYSREAGVDVL